MTSHELSPLHDDAWVRPPLSLRVARVLLASLMVLWISGCIVAARHLLTAIDTRETRQELRADALVLLERLLLAGSAGASLWTIARRKQVGRWLTIGLGTVVLFRFLQGLERTWRTLHLGLDTPLEQRNAYTTPAALRGALVVQCVLVIALLALIGRLAAAKNVGEYFKAPP